MNSIRAYAQYTRAAKATNKIRPFRYTPLYHKEFGCDSVTEKAVMLKFKDALKDTRIAKGPAAYNAALATLRRAGTKARNHLVACVLQRIAARTMTKENPSTQKQWQDRVSHEFYMILVLRQYRDVNKAMTQAFGHFGLSDSVNDPMWKALESDLSKVVYNGKFFSVSAKVRDPRNIAAFNSWYSARKTNINTLSNRVYNTVDWARLSTSQLTSLLPYQRRKLYPSLFPGHP